MTVLSDKTIREHMQAGNLVIGDERQAVHCSYEFLPGKIYPGGQQPDGQHVIDWTDAATRPADARYTIEPAAVVWVRAQHTVKLPNNVCGLWIKTNTLSRQGLMLINSSLVEPGYEGHLSCNFVNFGKSPVYLTPDKPIAKLLFLKLDGDALVPFETRFPKYDTMISETASHGPSTFLQISDVAATLEEERTKALEEIEKHTRERIVSLDNEKRLLLADAALELKKGRDKELESLKTDFDKYFKKALSVGVVAILAVAAVSWLSDWFRGKFSHDNLGKADIETLVEKEVAKRMQALQVLAPAQPSQSPQQVQQPQPKLAQPSLPVPPAPVQDASVP